MKKKHMMFRKSRTLALVIALAIIIAMVLGGTFALQDFNQHKTNYLSSDNKNLDVTLNEDFRDKYDWKKGETVDKKVSVTNVNVAGNAEPAYIRLKLTEYMDTTSIEYEYAMDNNSAWPYQPYRFLTEGGGDNIGTFITDANRGDLFLAVEDLGFTMNDITIIPYVNALIPGDTAKYYVITDWEDINGQYGKYLVVNINDKGTEFIAGKKVWTNKVQTNVNQFEQPTGSDAEVEHFAPFTFEKGVANSVYRNDARTYVDVNWGKMLLIDDWDGKPVDSWIYDPVSEYFYWGMPLDPPELQDDGTYDYKTSTTANLLDSLTLIKQPEGSFYYSLRVDMDAVIEDQIDDLTGTPQDILDAWSGDLCIISLFNKAIHAAFSDQAKADALFYGDESDSGTVKVTSSGIVFDCDTVDPGDWPGYYLRQLPVGRELGNVFPDCAPDGFTIKAIVQIDDSINSFWLMNTIKEQPLNTLAGESNLRVGRDASGKVQAGVDTQAAVVMGGNGDYSFSFSYRKDITTGQLVIDFSAVDPDGVYYVLGSSGLMTKSDTLSPTDPLLYDEASPGAFMVGLLNFVGSAGHGPITIKDIQIIKN